MDDELILASAGAVEDRFDKIIQAGQHEIRQHGDAAAGTRCGELSSASLPAAPPCGPPLPRQAVSIAARSPSFRHRR